MKIIDKKAVMKRAWKIFKGNSRYSDNFSESLKCAWKVEKENANPVILDKANREIIDHVFEIIA